ncbi:MAG: NADH-quinone oxidoreductase subunit J [Syntrophomonadaceae bacterium]|nr:NADH-quinone oxidoreductase subunit J [Syntrophomonadaceae bacterium]
MMFNFSAFSLFDAVFIAIAGVTVLAALGVVLFRNIIYSALSLILSFLGVAAIYFQLNSGFLGVIQILVYAGAISVLIIFAVMLLMNRDAGRTNLTTPRTKQLFAAGGITAMMLTALTAAIGFTKWPVAHLQGNDNSITMLAEAMLNDYVIAFEAAAILLLVAVIGAILIAKGVEDK